MTKPVILDGFCGGGGAGWGYHLAGFEVVGVDNRPMPNYPFRFVEGDFFEHVEKYGHLYDAIHASPPCEGYSRMRHLMKVWRPDLSWPMLIDETRRVLGASAKMYVIENVAGAPLDGITLCGTMVGLRVYRHRLFESNALLMQPEHPKHRVKIGPGRMFNDRRKPNAEGWVSHAGKGSVDGAGSKWGITGHAFRVAAGMAVMGLEHRMTRAEIAKAIPPAFAEQVGTQLRWHLEGAA